VTRLTPVGAVPGALEILGYPYPALKGGAITYRRAIATEFSRTSPVFPCMCCAARWLAARVLMSRFSACDNRTTSLASFAIMLAYVFWTNITPLSELAHGLVLPESTYFRQMAAQNRTATQEVVVSKYFMVLLVLLFSALAAAAQGSQSHLPAAPTGSQTIPADAMQQVNPVRPTPESIAQGKKYYGYDCAMCHGENGDGKGDVAVDEKLKLKDYRDPTALQNMSDGELFYVIKNGKGQMPPEGGRVKDAELWNLVNYIRSLSHK
jgi:mono/diheme cytochrome c family protein